MNTFWRLGWVGVLPAIALIGCTSGLPHELVERNDHAGLVQWYQQEATVLRAKADQMHAMAEEYAKPAYQLSPKETRTELINHCLRFFNYYTKAAEEAEALAKMHRERSPATP